MRVLRATRRATKTPRRAHVWREVGDGVELIIIIMPRVCCVPLCKHNKEKNVDLMFYQLPADSEKRLKWLQAIHRLDDNGKPWIPTSPYFYVCQKHFITGKFNNCNKLFNILFHKYVCNNMSRNPSDKAAENVVP